MIEQHQLPVTLLADLLSAFAQDVEKTRDAEGYADRAELLDYCRRSANPVGRLLLHLYGVSDAQALQQSDAICTRLAAGQFLAGPERGHCPAAATTCPAPTAQPTAPARPTCWRARPRRRMHRLIQDSADWARALMVQGAPLVHRLPGRMGWELRLVVQGGLRILDKVDALQGGSLHTRPRLHAPDWIVMLARAVAM